MKVKCIQLLNADGEKVELSSWLTLGQTYHVMAIHISPNGKKKYSIISRQPPGEWPQIGSHYAECFEIVSEIIPSNWRDWADSDGERGISPALWQEDDFQLKFLNHEPETYAIYEQERNIILREDP